MTILCQFSWPSCCLRLCHNHPRHQLIFNMILCTTESDFGYCTLRQSNMAVKNHIYYMYMYISSFVDGGLSIVTFDHQRITNNQIAGPFKTSGKDVQGKLINIGLSFAQLQPSSLGNPWWMLGEHGLLPGCNWENVIIRHKRLCFSMGPNQELPSQILHVLANHHFFHSFVS